MTYRLALDMGSNSIGWYAVELDSNNRPLRTLDGGVRILTPNEVAGRAPKSNASLAVNRRAARSMRRQRYRFVRRKERLVETLINAGLMPIDREERKKLAELDPYWLRKKALDEGIELYEIGRVVFHLNQHRGFQSNRIADSKNDEKSAMKQGIQALEAKLEESGARTLGELFANWHQRDRKGHRLDDDGSRLERGKGKGRNAPPRAVRFRPTSTGARNHWDFYPTRALIENEIDKIWEKQKKYHKALTPELLEKIKRILLAQRPLKPQVVGRCTLRPEKEIVNPYGFEIDLGERAPKAHPLFQRIRILQDACQLRVVRMGGVERYLKPQEHDAVVAMLMTRSTSPVLFEKLREAARLPDDVRFNYELSGRKGLPSNETASKLATKKAFGRAWRELSTARQIEVVERLLGERDEDELCHWLQAEFGLDKEAAGYVSEIRLPQGHGQLGRSVLRDLVEVMERESREAIDPDTGEVYHRQLTYDEAVAHLALHHSDHRPDQKARLPYYGEVLTRHVISQPAAPDGSQERIGRVSNPTVHVALNQLRKLVNALVATYGPPQEIVVELARELKWSRNRIKEWNSKNDENREKNDAARKKLEDEDLSDSYDNILRQRLYDELPAGERVCIYSGKPISNRCYSATRSRLIISCRIQAPLTIVL